MKRKKTPVTYARAGVHLDAADRWVNWLKGGRSRATWAKYLATGIGPFAAAWRVPGHFGARPIILAACDGVGTKLKYPISRPADLKVIGQDLVAMNVNDISAAGGTPILFLDYLACGRLKPELYQWVIRGVRAALDHCDALLIGGETAEMPACYRPDEFDLAGFAIGMARPGQLFRPDRNVKRNDVIIGVPSNGIHSNGFSLVHKVFSTRVLREKRRLFYRPTALYTPLTNRLLALKQPPKAAAHITGGGILDNAARVIPTGLCALIDTRCWRVPTVFTHIQRAAALNRREMFRTFNMGIGFVFVVSPRQCPRVLRLCQKYFKGTRAIGVIAKSRGSEKVLLA